MKTILILESHTAESRESTRKVEHHISHKKVLFEIKASIQDSGSLDVSIVLPGTRSLRYCFG